jgi:hypothetical protein
MSTEESSQTNFPTTSPTEFWRRRPTLAERLWYRQHFGFQDVIEVFDIDPARSWERAVHEQLAEDPLWGAIESRARERAIAAAQLVTQGTLAYAHAEDAAFRVERYIPVDIYIGKTDVESLREVTAAIAELFAALGFEYISYPAVALSSAHGRGSLKTRPITIDELNKTEGLIASGLDFNGHSVEQSAPTENSNVEKLKSLLELKKLQTEIDLAGQEIKKSKAETEKADAERDAAVMDKRNKFASLLLKIATAGVAISVGIGTFYMESNPPQEQAKPVVTVQTHSVERSSHLKDFGKFVTKLAEQAEAGDE